METKGNEIKPRRVQLGLTVGGILAALYVPQLWFFLMDSQWDGYWLHWLKLFPGLPVFFPVAVLTHPNETLTMWSLWLTTGLVAAGLSLLSQRKPALYWIGLTLACALSAVSAYGAYSVFRA